MKQATEIANWSLFSKNELRFLAELSHLQTWSLMSYFALCQQEDFYWLRNRWVRRLSIQKGKGSSRKEVSLFPESAVLPGTQPLRAISPPFSGEEGVPPGCGKGWWCWAGFTGKDATVERLKWSHKTTPIPYSGPLHEWRLSYLSAMRHSVLLLGLLRWMRHSSCLFFRVNRPINRQFQFYMMSVCINLLELP